MRYISQNFWINDVFRRIAAEKLVHMKMDA